MGIFAGVFDFLADIGVDQETINEIGSMLQSNSEILDGARPTGQTQGAFGQSLAGRDLDAQTLTAHEHVIEALEEMMVGLEGYRVNVTRFADDMFGLDADVQAALMRGVDEAETYTGPGDFHDNGIAPPEQPGGDQGGDR